jgi:hypothetical protein
MSLNRRQKVGGPMKNRGLARLVSLVAVLCFLAVQPAAAQSTTYAKEGVYVGALLWPATTIEGNDFDGDHILFDANQVILIPRLNSAEGLGFVFGGRFRSGGVEIGYLRATHRASFGSARGTSRSHVVNVDGRYYFASGTRIQPNLSGGLAIPWLITEEGSASPTDVGDATILGVGVNVGGGLAVYVHPRVAISGGYNYRLMVFPRAKGVSGSFQDIDDEVEPRAKGANLTLSVTFTL